MYSSLIILLVSIVSSLAQSEIQKCGAYESFHDCVSSCYPEPTCQNIYPQKDELCIEQCKPKCLCMNGYIRSSDGGSCIKLEDCKNACKEDEVLGCLPCCGPPTCQQKGCRILCLRFCKRGCMCKFGFVYDKFGGKCIPVDTCPK